MQKKHIWSLNCFTVSYKYQHCAYSDATEVLNFRKFFFRKLSQLVSYEIYERNFADFISWSTRNNLIRCPKLFLPLDLSFGHSTTPLILWSLTITKCGRLKSTQFLPLHRVFTSSGQIPVIRVLATYLCQDL